jgi:sugar lactone lactonase YvrE
MQQQSTEALGFIGTRLQRPECVLVTKRSEIFVSDRQGVAVISPDGATRRVVAKSAPDHFLPNGIALLPDRSLLVADLGLGGGVLRLTLDGELTPWLNEVDGKALHPTNFVGLDHQGRFWITVSTHHVPREKVMGRGRGDGYIILKDDRGARIVAEGLDFTNEAVPDPAGEYLYVNETQGRRLSRFPIRKDGLGPKQVVCEFEEGVWPDGLAHDAEGGVWVVSVISNRVLRVDPATGQAKLFLEDADDADVQRIEAHWRSGELLPRPMLDAGGKRLLGNASSLAFGGPDLRTLYIGTLFGERIAHLPAPVAGAMPPHWNF